MICSPAVFEDDSGGTLEGGHVAFGKPVWLHRTTFFILVFGFWHWHFRELLKVNMSAKPPCNFGRTLQAACRHRFHVTGALALPILHLFYCSFYFSFSFLLFWGREDHMVKKRELLLVESTGGENAGFFIFLFFFNESSYWKQNGNHKSLDFQGSFQNFSGKLECGTLSSRASKKKIYIYILSTWLLLGISEISAWIRKPLWLWNQEAWTLPMDFTLVENLLLHQLIWWFTDQSTWLVVGWLIGPFICQLVISSSGWLIDGLTEKSVYWLLLNMSI